LPERYSRHRQITELATQGKFVLDWNGEDCRACRPERPATESLPQVPCQEYDCFVRPDPTGTSRTLLAAQETYQPRTVRNWRQQKTSRIADVDFKSRKMFAL